MKKKGRHPTLIEVARKAGVGATTVSRAINGGHRVDPKTLIRIQRAIDALGYMPNQAARTLKGDRTRIIGFVIPSIADPFFSSCAEAAQAVARAHDSLLIVLTTQGDVATELDAIQTLMRHRVDGFVIAPADSDNVALHDLLRNVPVPVVALDRPITGVAVPCVVTDNFAGAQLATQHLIGHGYRRIVCLSGETGLYTIQERERGYREAMQDAKLKPVIESSVANHAPAHAIARLLAGRKPPDAFFTLKNSITIDTFQALSKLNITVPSTVALLGYDDFQLADMLRPSVSVVQQPINQLGHAATELLFQRLVRPAGTEDGAAVLRTDQVQLKTHLVLRESCGCLPDSAAC